MCVCVSVAYVAVLTCHVRAIAIVYYFLVNGISWLGGMDML